MSFIYIHSAQSLKVFMMGTVAELPIIHCPTGQLPESIRQECVPLFDYITFYLVDVKFRSNAFFSIEYQDANNVKGVAIPNSPKLIERKAKLLTPSYLSGSQDAQFLTLTPERLMQLAHAIFVLELDTLDDLDLSTIDYRLVQKDSGRFTAEMDIPAKRLAQSLSHYPKCATGSLGLMCKLVF